MAFSYAGHYKYLELGGALEDSISGTLNYNMMEMHARSQEALEAVMQQQARQQLQHLPEEPPAAKKPAKVRNEQQAAYKRAQTNAQKAHNDRIKKKNEERITSAMKSDKVPVKDVKKIANSQKSNMPDSHLQEWAQ